MRIRLVCLLAVFTLAFSLLGAAAHDTGPGGLPFDDVSRRDWFYNAIVWTYENGVMNGISNSFFDPNGEMTRGMLVTVLWRYAGSPSAGTPTFADVQSGRWYSDAVAWANENGIVTGHSPVRFGVNEPVTREQMYTILYRYMNFAELTLEIEADDSRLVEFDDEAYISDWALDAMYLMYDAGIMYRLGPADESARPRTAAFRAEIASSMFIFDSISVPLSIIYE